jgi:hypothetical protein
LGYGAERWAVRLDLRELRNRLLLLVAVRDRVLVGVTEVEWSELVDEQVTNLGGR